MGAQGYFLLSRKPGAKYGFWGIGVVTVAVMITGTRTPFVFVIGSAFVMTAAFLWGAPWRWGQGHRLVKALRRGFLIGGLGLILMVEVFPTVIGGNWAFFQETLFQGTARVPISRAEAGIIPCKISWSAFQEGDLLTGHGTGMSSLGMQYVSRFLNEHCPSIQRGKRLRGPHRGDGHFWSDSLACLGFGSCSGRDGRSFGIFAKPYIFHWALQSGGMPWWIWFCSCTSAMQSLSELCE